MKTQILSISCEKKSKLEWVIFFECQHTDTETNTRDVDNQATFEILRSEVGFIWIFNISHTLFSMLVMKSFISTSFHRKINYCEFVWIKSIVYRCDGSQCRYKSIGPLAVEWHSPTSSRWIKREGKQSKTSTLYRYRFHSESKSKWLTYWIIKYVR